MGWGWCLSDEAATRTVELEMNYSDGMVQIVPCMINRARDDVALANPSNPRSSTAGFIFLSRLASRSRILGASLLVIFTDGVREVRQIPGFPGQFAPGAVTTQTVMTKVSKVWSLAKTGQVSYLFDALHRAFRRSSQNAQNRISSGPLPVGSVVLLFDHQLGGGANRYRGEEIATLMSSGSDVVLVTFDLPRLQYLLVVHRSSGTSQETHDSLDALQARLMQAHFSGIHVNDFVSYPDPLAMLGLVRKLVRDDSTELVVYLHDYLFVCPSYTLLNATGTYCGVPDAATCKACLRDHRAIFPSFVMLKQIEPWREAWGEFFRLATTIVAFSESTIEIFRRAFPNSDWHEKIAFQPHVIDKLRYPKIVPRLDHPLKVAIIGNIGFAKGAELVHEMLSAIEQNQLPVHIVVIGTLERYVSSRVLTVTGSFENSALPRLIQQHGIGMCLLPSICPETFSYVTEEIMTMELPLVCFDLGAPAIRVKRYRWGAVAGETSAAGALQAIMLLAKKVATESHV